MKKLLLLGPVLLLISVYSQAQQPALGYCSPLTEEAARATCQAFREALQARRLLYPEENSAYHYLLRLEEETGAQPLLDTCRASLIDRLRDEARQCREAIQQAPADAEVFPLRFDRPLPYYAQYLDKAVGLLGEEDPLRDSLRLQQLYLEGVSLREQGTRDQTVDTLLLREAVQKQLDALKISYNEPYILNELGILLFTLQDYESSVLFFKMANQQAAGWAPPLIGLSQCATWVRSEKEALQLAEYAVVAENNSTAAFLNCAHTFAEFGNPDKSLAYYNATFAQLQARIQAGGEKAGLSDLFVLGRLLTDFELYEEAGKYFRAILDRQAVFPAYLWLGKVYERSNRVLEADSVFRICIQRWPERLEGYLQLGLLYHSLQDYPTARIYYEKAREINPRHKETCFNLAAILELFKQPEVARPLFEEALVYPSGLDTVYTKIDSALAVVRKNTILVELLPEADRYLAEFLPEIRQPVSLFEDQAFAGLGKIYLEENRLPEAALMYRSALLLNPGLEEAYQSLIRICLEQKAYQEAVRFIQLYQIYIPNNRESRETHRQFSQTLRELTRTGAHRLTDDQLFFYTYILDNLWFYLTGLDMDGTLELDPATLKRQQKNILKILEN